MSSIHPSSIPEWRLILRKNFTNWLKLADFLELDLPQRESILPFSKFPLNLPLRLAEKIEKGMLEDPLLRQFLPRKEELIIHPNFTKDPVGDGDACRGGSKLLHKYQGRVLLIVTSACAMHCRFCFRQNFDYDVQNKGFEQELAIIREDPTIHEVILSGGDPLSLSDEALYELIQPLSAMPHVRRLRFHSRFPLGIPERIDDNFLSLLKEFARQVVFVLHTNHPRELDGEILSRMELMKRQGVILLNQSVLLKGVNDDLPTLQALCEKLADHGILPYYLHQLDRVQGASHFEVSESEGRMLVQQLANVLSGYAVPKYVREIAGERGKTLL